MLTFAGIRKAIPMGQVFKKVSSSDSYLKHGTGMLDNQLLSFHEFHPFVE